jgi:type VI protein secretion system component Hcp
MKKTILIAGFACLSLMLVAQTSGSKDQAASAAKDQHAKEVASGQASGNAVAPRDTASGQASGKRQHNPVVIKQVSDEGSAARQQQSPKATGVALKGNKSASDDWTSRAANSNGSTGSSGQTRVATGDVNGDGKADAAINTSHSNIKNGDIATGHTSGKRMHEPVVVTKTTDSASPKQ